VIAIGRGILQKNARYSLLGLVDRSVSAKANFPRKKGRETGGVDLAPADG
jgi:hypothetical protein